MLEGPLPVEVAPFGLRFERRLAGSQDDLSEQGSANPETKSCRDVAINTSLVDLGFYPGIRDLVEIMIALFDELGLIFFPPHLSHDADISPAIGQQESGCFRILALGLVFILDRIDRFNAIRNDVGHLVAEIAVGPERVAVVARGVSYLFYR